VTPSTLAWSACAIVLVVVVMVEVPVVAVIEVVDLQPIDTADSALNRSDRISFGPTHESPYLTMQSVPKQATTPGSSPKKIQSADKQAGHQAQPGNACQAGFVQRWNPSRSHNFRFSGRLF
jgi:hypothetical protein